MGQFRASDEDWKLLRKDGGCFWDRIIRELGDRVAALEAEREATCKPALQVADDLPPEPEPSPSPAGDAGLVDEVLDAMGEGTEVEARAAIHAVARWLARRCSSPDGKESRWLIDSIQQILHEEANR